MTHDHQMSAYGVNMDSTCKNKFKLTAKLYNSHEICYAKQLNLSYYLGC